MNALARLTDMDAIARLRAHDATLFGDDPAEVALASRSLGWTRLAKNSSDILEQVRRLAREATEKGLTDVVLLGMGGSSLGALVIGDVLGADSPVRLRVLDTTCPRTIDAAIASLDPATTIYLVSSKSGGTIEPNSLYAIFREVADGALGHEEGGHRFIALTDPGSPLEAAAAAGGFSALVSTPENVGGRFSALTPFGLVPAELLGIDAEELLRRAGNMEAACDLPAAENPAARLAAFIFDAHAAGRDKLTIVSSEPLNSFGLWVEQLVAESLGKEGTGVVPVVELSPDFPQGYGGDRAIVVVRLASDERLAEWTPKLALAAPVHEIVLRDGYDIGAQFSLWEHATALLGPLFGVNPFGQPNVQSAKDATNSVLTGALSAPESNGCTPDGIVLTYAGGLPDPGHDEPSLATALGHALAAVRPGDYLAPLVYLPDDAELLAPLLEAVPRVSAATGAAVTFELGPRYLHSTGQLHKGGPNTGVFIVVTTRDAADAPVPGRSWGLRTLFRSQAEGDIATLVSAGRRVLHVDLPDAGPEAVTHLAHALLDAAGVRWEA
jgi:transaldolase / glucose-6-phosphate isomerase